MEKPRDWVAWHEAYDREGSRLAQRLRVVQELLAGALDGCAPGPIRLLSMCAGQAHDILGVLPTHPRREEVRALLAELDPTNAGIVRRRLDEAGLAQVEVVEADAGAAATYERIVPADVLVVCGVFGNIPLGDIARTVLELRALAAPRAWVLWTRGRSEQEDATPAIRRWFIAAGYEEVAFVAPPILSQEGRGDFSVGCNRLVAAPLPYVRDAELFRFDSAANY
jgi:hypothetical protein